MKRFAIFAATATVAAVFAGPASAEPLGPHVAMCAHELGARTGAPAVTCTHDGATFATFGAMVQHMRAMH
jgi:hypothetical protein